MRVNLPRWGLKLDDIEKYPFSIWGVNLPRWGLKLLRSDDNLRIFAV